MALLARIAHSFTYRINRIARRLLHPILYRRVTRRFVSLTEDYVKTRGGRMFPYGKEERVTFPAPIQRGSITNPYIEKLVGEHVLPRPFVAELPEVIITYAHNLSRKITPLGITQRGEILQETTHHGEFLARDLDVFSRVDEIGRLATNAAWRKPRPGQRLEMACTLAFEVHANFYHWIADVLPRLRGLMQYEAETGLHPSLVVIEPLAGWQRELLHVMGYSEDRIVALSTEGASVKRLVIPSFVRHEWVTSAEAICWLRDWLAEHIQPSQELRAKGRRFYMTRRTAPRRVTENEDAIMEALASRGFELINGEDYDPAEMAGLFADAEFIIGPHGAALANMLYSPAATILEFGAPNFPPFYYAMASALGLRYGYLIGQRTERDGVLVAIDELIHLTDSLMDIPSR